VILIRRRRAGVRDNTPPKAELPAGAARHPSPRSRTRRHGGDQVAPPPSSKPALLVAPAARSHRQPVRFHLYDLRLVDPVAGEGIDLYASTTSRTLGDPVDISTVDDAGPARPPHRRPGASRAARAATLIAPWPGGGGQARRPCSQREDDHRAVDGKTVGTGIYASMPQLGTYTFDLPVDAHRRDHRSRSPARTRDRQRRADPRRRRRPRIAGEPFDSRDRRDGVGADGRPLHQRWLPRVTGRRGGAAAITRSPRASKARPTRARCGSGTADGTEQTIDLAPIAGKLVALSFTGPCTTRMDQSGDRGRRP